jgi:hypothetical protein
MTAGRIERRQQIAARLVAGAMLLAGGSLGAQAPFEGAVTIRMSSKTPQGVMSQQMEYFMRAGKVRVNMAAPAGMPMAGPSLILSPAEKKMYMLMPAQSAYMELPMSDSLATAAAQRAPGMADDAKIVRTGKRETVAGLSCEHVQVIAKAGTADMCVSKELGRFVNPTDAMRQSGGGWQRELGNEFPLKVTMPDGSVPIEVVKVERKRLSNELFTVPGTYNKMTMPARRPPVEKPPVE